MGTGGGHEANMEVGINVRSVLVAHSWGISPLGNTMTKRDDSTEMSLENLGCQVVG